MQTATVKGDITPHRTQPHDPDRFNASLQRLLLGAASELGQRGNLGQVVAAIERGGAGGGSGEDPNISMLRRLGATDTRGIDGRAGALRRLEQRWLALAPKHQRIALAHYLGTPRAHPTIREHFGNGSDPEAQQGSLAGVVLLRWQDRQAKARARAATASSAGTIARLEALRAELAPLEREAASLVDLLEQTLTLPDHDEPRPVPPPFGTEGAELCRARKVVQAEWSAYRTAERAWCAPVRFLVWQHQERRRMSVARLEQLRALVAPLKAEQTRLCAALADVAASAGAGAGGKLEREEDFRQDPDEQALVLLCRSGKLDADAHLRAAAEEVRALHRAWLATTLTSARNWLEDEAQPA